MTVVTTGRRTTLLGKHLFLERITPRKIKNTRVLKSTKKNQTLKTNSGVESRNKVSGESRGQDAIRGRILGRHPAVLKRNQSHSKTPNA